MTNVYSFIGIHSFVVIVQSPSHVRLSATPWTAAHQASLSLTISQSLPKFMSIASVMPSNHLILWCPLLLLPSVFPSIRDVSSESAVCIRWPKYCSFSFSTSLSDEYSGLISCKSDWFDLLAVQGTLRSLFHYHSFEGINSSSLCLLYCLAHTTVCDHWEGHSLDYTDLCQQSKIIHLVEVYWVPLLCQYCRKINPDKQNSFSPFKEEEFVSKQEWQQTSNRGHSEQPATQKYSAVTWERVKPPRQPQSYFCRESEG